MEKTPWSEEMKNQINEFGRMLLAIKKQLEAARTAGLPAQQFEINEIDRLLDEFEKGFRERTELERQWQAKQPELLELQKEGVRLLAEAREMKIQSQADYEQAQRHLAEVRRNEDLVKAIFDPFITTSDQNYRRLVKLEDQILAKLKFDNDGSA